MRYASSVLTYVASYKTRDRVCFGEVLDFPGAVAQGATLDEARRNLSQALHAQAEIRLRRGEPLPDPDPGLSDLDAEVEEPIHLVFVPNSSATRQ